MVSREGAKKGMRIIKARFPISPRHPRAGGAPSPGKRDGWNLEIDSRLRGSDDVWNDPLHHPQPRNLRAHLRQIAGKAGMIPHPRDQRDKDRLPRRKFGNRPRHIA